MAYGVQQLWCGVQFAAAIGARGQQVTSASLIQAASCRCAFVALPAVKLHPEVTGFFKVVVQKDTSS
jgi:hypothetical protein